MMRMDQHASYDESSAAEVKEADKLMVMKRVFGGEVDMDQESNGSSSEEMESPRSVVKAMGRWRSNSKEKIGIGMCVHSQILRIRDEDSHVGQDFSTEVLNLFAKDDKQHPLASLPLVVFSKPILPASPLGGKTIIKTSD